MGLPGYIFLKTSRELVTEDIGIGAFLNGNFNTPNGILVRDLVQRLYQDFADVPPPYQTLLSDLAKKTSVSGFLQCTRAESLEILKVKYFFLFNRGESIL